MKNFDESFLSENGVNVIDYIADDAHQAEIMQEVAQLGDPELSVAYKDLFDGDKDVLKKACDLKTLYLSNDQVKLIKESITQNNYKWLKKLLREGEMQWFAEKMVAETKIPELINILLSRHRLGWATQNIIIEFRNPEWMLKLIKKQEDLSSYVKNFIILNESEEIVCKLVKHSYLSAQEQHLIIDLKYISAIKDILSYQKEDLYPSTLIKIVELQNKELTKLVSKIHNLDDEVKAFIIENCIHKEIVEEIVCTQKLGKLAQKAVIKLENAALIRNMIHHNPHRIPINIHILETLNLSLIKEFIGNIKNLSKSEKKYVYSSGNTTMIEMVNALA